MSVFSFDKLAFYDWKRNTLSDSISPTLMAEFQWLEKWSPYDLSLTYLIYLIQICKEFWKSLLKKYCTKRKDKIKSTKSLSVKGQGRRWQGKQTTPGNTSGFLLPEDLYFSLPNVGPHTWPSHSLYSVPTPSGNIWLSHQGLLSFNSKFSTGRSTKFPPFLTHAPS